MVKLEAHVSIVIIYYIMVKNSVAVIIYLAVSTFSVLYSC